jgi:phage baseplate assembly protein W
MARLEKVFVGFSTVDRRVANTRMYDIELIKQDLRNHFMTRKGERVMNPNYGSIIWFLLFEPFTESIKQQVLGDVERIIRSEPRVEIVNIDLLSTDYGLTLNVLLNYKPFNLTDTLYVEYVRTNFNTGITQFSEDLGN